MTLRLRPADPGDRYLLWLWANDPAAREASGDRATISWDDHCRWFAKRIDSTMALIWIAETSLGQPVGVARFETESDWKVARLSYAVAPESRGRGYGRELLELGLAAVRGRRPGVRVEAQVRDTNEPSLRAFRQAGWLEGPSGRAGWVSFVATEGAP